MNHVTVLHLLHAPFRYSWPPMQEDEIVSTIRGRTAVSGTVLLKITN